jgi:hypothetical protein
MNEINTLDVLHSLLTTDRVFYQTIRFLDSGRARAIATQQQNTAAILELVRTYVPTPPPPTNLRFPINITIPSNSLPTSWADPVTVRPTADQIDAATETVPAEDSTCAICQEAIEDDAIRLTHCRHEFHNHCITEWFTRSVHCPNCRHDVREVDQTEPTSSDQVHTPPRVRNRLAAWLGVDSPTLRTGDTEESDEHHA